MVHRLIIKANHNMEIKITGDSLFFMLNLPFKKCGKQFINEKYDC